MRLDYIVLKRLYYDHKKEKQYLTSSCRELIFPNIKTSIPVFIKPYTDKLREDFNMMRYSMQNEFYIGTHQKAWVFAPRYTQFINYLSDYGVAHFLKNFVFDFSKKKIGKSYISQLLLKSKILPPDSNDYNGLYSFMAKKVNLKSLYKFLDDKYAR